MIIAGIDTGKRGALVVANTDSSFARVELLKYDEQGHLLNDFNQILKNAELILIEKIHARGGWSANVCFKMGYYFGQVVKHVMTLNKDMEYVTPVSWTSIVHRELDLETLANKNVKAKSLAAYHLYHPHDPIFELSKKKSYHDGIVDALMIVTYYLLQNNCKIPKWIFEKGNS